MGKRRRGNGTGSVYKLPSGKWRGAVTLGQWIDENGKVHRQVVSKNFDKKKDAIQWVSLPETRMEKKPNIFNSLENRFPITNYLQTAIQAHLQTQRPAVTGWPFLSHAPI